MVYRTIKIVKLGIVYYGFTNREFENGPSFENQRQL
jgi:hypothetical protein